MSLGALLTGDAPIVWRLTFGSAGIAGMDGGGVVASRGIEDPTGRSPRSDGSSGGPPAVRPDLRRVPARVHPENFQLELLQIEGVIMTFLVFLGIMFAWLLFTEPQRTAGTREG